MTTKIYISLDKPDYLPEVAQLIFKEWKPQLEKQKIYTLQQCLQYLINEFQNKKNSVMFLAIKNNILQGFVFLEEKDMIDRKQYSPWLSSLYVKEEYRHRGIATKYRHRNKFNLPPHFLKYKGKSLLLPFKASNYENYDLISDYFQEKARIKCLRFREQYTPYQYFENELPNIIKKAHSQYGKVNAHSMREAIFQLSNECSSFLPQSLFQLFKCLKANVC